MSKTSILLATLEGVKREKGYLYFVGTAPNGDLEVHKALMSRGGRRKKK